MERSTSDIARTQVVDAGPLGVTCRELETITGIGHGAMSGALNRLERTGLIVRPADTYRNGDSVYVAAEYASGTRLAKPRRPSATPADIPVLDFAGAAAEQAKSEARDLGFAEGFTAGERAMILRVQSFLAEVADEPDLPSMVRSYLSTVAASLDD